MTLFKQNLDNVVSVEQPGPQGSFNPVMSRVGHLACVAILLLTTEELEAKGDRLHETGTIT